MKTYRRKHAVKAMRWTDTDEDREKLSDWFEFHDVLFQTIGPIALLPEAIARNGETQKQRRSNRIAPGAWILWTGDEFIALAHEEFIERYEEVS